MARSRCPGCGAHYNGRKCTQCLYVPFDTEESGYHSVPVYEKPSAPTPRPAAPAPKPYGKNTAPWQQKKKSAAGTKVTSSILAVIVVMVLTSVFNIIMPMLEDFSASVSYAQPEPAPDLAMPMGGLVLYEEEDLLVMADWEEGTPIEGDIRILVENRTGRDLIVQTADAAVNGIMADPVFFYCDALDGCISEGTLWVWPEDLQYLGIDQISWVDLCLDIYDNETYETVCYTDVIRMKTGVPPADRTDELPGFPIYDADGLILTYLGCEQTESGSYLLSFYAENCLDRRVSLSTTEIGLDGLSTDTFLWQNLLPGSRAYFTTEIYDPAYLELPALEDAETMEFVLYADDPTDWTSIVMTDPLTFPVHP